jgi:LacI family transcriptional regulator
MPAMTKDRPITTIEDVAREAGVSIATVSRVMNQRGTTNPEIVTRVNAAISKLGYVPRAAARGLKNRRTGLIGVVLPALQAPAYARFADAIEKGFKREGYSLLFASSEEDHANELAAVRRLAGIGIDAVVLVGASQTPELLNLLRLNNIPSVRTFTLAVRDSIPTVGFDIYRAAFDLATYVLDLGHRQIGVIAARRSNDRAAAYLSGIHDAVAAHGIAWSDDIYYEATQSFAEGAGAMHDFLARSKRPTAVLCDSGLFALGAMAQAQRESFRVPEDISIASFDDFDMAAHCADPLTAIQVPVDGIARAVVESLRTGLSKGLVPHSAEMPYSLIVRASTAPPE